MAEEPAREVSDDPDLHANAEAPEPRPGEDEEDITPPDLAPRESPAPRDASLLHDTTGIRDFVVIARQGLKIRSTPDGGLPGGRTNEIGLLPFGTRVRVDSRVGEWALVDAVGDGAADGFVHSAYLRKDGAAPSGASAGTSLSARRGTAFVPLDKATLQTIMDRCAGTPIKSRLDLNETVYALNKSMALANASSLIRKVAFLSQAVIETDYFRTYTEYGRGKGKKYAPYYGRGIHQLTWKDTYRSCSRAIFHDDRLVDDPDLITKDIEVNVKATAWYWRDYKPFNSLADVRDVDGIIRLLYGGTIHSSDPKVRHSVELRRGYYDTIASLLT